MHTDILPYLLLLLAVLFSFGKDPRLSAAATVAAVLFGFVFGRIEGLGILSLALTASAAKVFATARFGKAVRGLALVVLLAMTYALFNHVAPGFKNLLVFDKFNFSADSVPFSMYLNFDKVVAALVIFGFYVRRHEAVNFGRQALATTARTWIFLIALLMPLALYSGYVRLDPKFPALGWLWVLNNLFFVAFAEETLFRGLIQGGLTRFFPKRKVFAYLAIGLAAVLFGLSHFAGGISYVIFAGVAGLFYGYAYLKTGRLAASMFVHFGLNAAHFFLFSYPALG